MGRVEEAEQEADSDGLDVGGENDVRDAPDLLLGQRHHHVALAVDPLGDLEHQLAGNPRLRLPEAEVEHLVSRLGPDLEDVPESPRGEQRGPRQLELQERIGRCRGAVREEAQRGKIQPLDVAQRADAGDHALGGIMGSARDLVDDVRAVVSKDDHVRERSADVDAKHCGHELVFPAYDVARSAGGMP